jgi:hypothetical protein
LAGSGGADGTWYVHRSAYWVPAGQAADYPVRQGDLFGPLRVDGDSWEAAIIVHPTCELSKASVGEIQVARVRSLSALSDDRQRVAVLAGLNERDGRVRVAFAHTFFVAPVPDSHLAEPMWADLREIAPAVRGQFTPQARIGTLTHDARVTFMRRYVYSRFRLALSFEQVRDLEAARIGADPAFHGPRPAWATT